MKALPILLAAGWMMLLGGCSALGYYGQTIHGQLEILNKARPIPEMMADPATPALLKQRLQLVQQLRLFSIQQLQLPDNGSYTRYADLGRDYVNWVVIATPEFSIEPKRWCFPVVGCLSYRGHFERTAAEQEADALRQQGLDVYMAGSQAFSTLGWFDDPVLNTLLKGTDLRLAETLFHELSHQKLYFKDDTAFNEAFAVAVSQHGVTLWLRQQGADARLLEYQQGNRHSEQFQQLLIKTQQSLQQLYTSHLPPQEMRTQKARLFQTLRDDYRQLKASWGGTGGYDRWLEQPLNNAHLSIVATYHQLVPLFLQRLQQCDNQLPRFYRLVQSWQGLSAPQRLSELKRSGC